MESKITWEKVNFKNLEDSKGTNIDYWNELLRTFFALHYDCSFFRTFYKTETTTINFYGEHKGIIQSYLYSKKCEDDKKFESSFS